MVEMETEDIEEYEPELPGRKVIIQGGPGSQRESRQLRIKVGA